MSSRKQAGAGLLSASPLASARSTRIDIGGNTNGNGGGYSLTPRIDLDRISKLPQDDRRLLTSRTPAAAAAPRNYWEDERLFDLSRPSPRQPPPVVPIVTSDFFAPKSTHSTKHSSITQRNSVWPQVLADQRDQPSSENAPRPATSRRPCPKLRLPTRDSNDNDGLVFFATARPHLACPTDHNDQAPRPPSSARRENHTHSINQGNSRETSPVAKEQKLAGRRKEERPSPVQTSRDRQNDQGLATSRGSHKESPASASSRTRFERGSNNGSFRKHSNAAEVVQNQNKLDGLKNGVQSPSLDIASNLDVGSFADPVNFLQDYNVPRALDDDEIENAAPITNMWGNDQQQLTKSESSSKQTPLTGSISYGSDSLTGSGLLSAATPSGSAGVPSGPGSSTHRALEVMVKVNRKKRGSAKVAEEANVHVDLLGLETQVSLKSYDLAEVELNELMEKLRKNPHQEVPVRQFADLCKVYATRRRTRRAEELQVPEMLLFLMRKNANVNQSIIAYCLDAVSELIFNESEEMLLQAARRIPAIINVPAIVSNDDCVEAYLELLSNLCINQPASALQMLHKEKILDDVAQIRVSLDDDETDKIDTIEGIQRALSQKSRHDLTLKDIYSYLLNRQQSLDPCLDISNDRLLKRLTYFVMKKTKQYGVNQVIEDGVQGFSGSEFMYGCMCVQVLATEAKNVPVLKAMDVADLLIQSLRRQTDEQIVQHPVLTTLELFDIREMRADFVNSKEKRDLYVSLLKRARKATENDEYSQVEDLVGPRVQLIEKAATCPEAGSLADTKAFEEVVSVWDDSDFYHFGNIRVRTETDLRTIIKEDRRTRNTAQDAATGATDAFAGAGKLVRRASQLFTKKKKSEEIVPPIPMVQTGVSPLDRRRSSVGAAVIERRRSNIGAGAPPVLAAMNRRRSSIGGADGGGPSLVRRASQFLGNLAGIGATENHQGTTIAMARRQSMLMEDGQQMPKRRLSLLGRKDSARPMEVGSGGGTAAAPRASQMQRRASMVNQQSFDRVEKKVKRHSIEQDSPAAEPSVHSSSSSSSSDESDEDGSNDSGPRRQTTRASSMSSKSSRFRHWLEDDNSLCGDPEGEVSKMMEYVTAALRRLTVPSKYQTLYDSKIPLRLVGLLADPETSPLCFPHVLYLIGVTTPFEDLRDLYGTLQTVERIISLLKRAHNKVGLSVSESITNGCLALANLVVLHIPNIRHFTTARGDFLVPVILKVRGKYKDTPSLNAASALICNLCFRNEEMKSVMGRRGACEALVEAMRSYECESEQDQLENGIIKNSSVNTISMSSVFRAIGNLALNKTNMDRFIAARIEEAFGHFLGEADEALDSATLEACFKTLSNLVIEKDNMQRFASVIVPFLSLLRKERHQSAEAHRWAFMSLANLCRLAENAQVFTKNEGIQTVIMLLPFLESSHMLRLSVVWVLGIQTIHPPNMDVLLDVGVFKVVADMLKSYLELTDNITGEFTLDTNSVALARLPVCALRCAHRLLKTERAAKECAKSEVFRLALRLSQLDHDSSMTLYEALRVLFATMALFDPTQLGSVDTCNFLKGRIRAFSIDEDALTVSYDRILAGLDLTTGLPAKYEDPCDPRNLSLTKSLAAHVHLDRRVDTRPWYILNATPHLPAVVENVRRVISKEKNHRNIRLQRLGVGFLSWVACERICVPALFNRLDGRTDHDDHEDENVVPAHLKTRFQRRKSIWERVGMKATPRAGGENADDDLMDNQFGRHPHPDATGINAILTNTINNLFYDEDVMTSAFVLLNSMIFISFGCPNLAKKTGDTVLYQMLKKRRNKGDAISDYALFTIDNYKRFMQTEGKLTPDVVARSKKISSKISNAAAMNKDDTWDATSDEGDGTANTGHSVSYVGTKSSSGQEIFTLLDLNLMFKLAITDYPAELTQWNIEPFPDGVMSLLPETRAYLRKGASFFMLDSFGDRSQFHWRASHDLCSLEWRILPLKAKADAILVDPTYPHSIAVSRILNIAIGANHSNFTRASAHGGKVHEHRAFSLTIPGIASEEYKNGATIALEARDQSSRDIFLRTLSQWRESSAFGFI